ncbi:MAG: dihydroorotate dehydrogenase [Planctomycetes bacterium]|nr:dihydroorotate dehydrogenase [Planctomycetota bacterium]
MDSNLPVDLRVDVGPLRLSNPLMTASGTCGYGEELLPFTDPAQLGAIVVKSVTLEPRLGNPTPRTVETPCGLLNSIGLQNPGVRALVEEILPGLRRLSCPIVVNIAGEKVEEYAQLARCLASEPGIAALELNISCPNVEQGGIAFGQDPRAVASVVGAVRAVWRGPLIAKLTPNVTDVRVPARAAVDAGADLLSLVNTYVGMSVDWRSGRSRIGRPTGGLSGPAIKPLALYAVWRVAGLGIAPVIGIGGAMTGRDVLEFLSVGASAVQIGTALFRDPGACVRALEEIRGLLAAAGISRISDLIGRFAPSA